MKSLEIKKSYMLEKIIDRLPLTKELFLKSYGKRALKRAQKRLRKKDAVIFAKKIMIDLDGWKKEDFEINFTFDNGKLDGIPAIAFSPFVTCITEIVEKNTPIGENSVRCPGSKFGCLRCLKCWLSTLNVEFEIHK